MGRPRNGVAEDTPLPIQGSTKPMVDTVSKAEARRIALAAQGFRARRSAAPSGWPRIEQAVRTMAVLQIDSVNVLSRSHYLPVFSRIGAYSRTLLDRKSLAPKGRQLFEYWAHEASFLPLDSQPLFRWRMAQAQRGQGIYKGLATFARERRDYVDTVRAEVADRGPLVVRELSAPGDSTGSWWGWSDGKIALEYLFWTGEVTAAGRRTFERVYDLTERALPAEIIQQPSPDEPDAIRQLVSLSAGALGIATETDLRDYFRLPVAACRQAVAELIESGTLQPVTVEGWTQPAFLAPGAEAPLRLTPTALLSPFDPLVWFRDRAERLFDFHYRLELYTPPGKRRFGYYVLPFLMKGRLAGRVDLKADRANSTLLVQGAFSEPREKEVSVASALAPELRLLADWLGLEHVRLLQTGNLAAALVSELPAGETA